MLKLSFVLSVISLLGFLLLGVYIFNSPPKLVYVDSVKLISGYKGMQDSRAVYQKKSTVWKANIDSLSREVQTSILNYEKESSKMTAKERSLSEELIRTKQKQLINYQQALNTQAQQEDQKMTAEVMAQVNGYLKKYGKDKGYKIIMAATEYGNIAYADEGLDITNEVLEGLNKEYTGK
jgi:outer membrane protein